MRRRPGTRPHRPAAAQIRARPRCPCGCRSGAGVIRPDGIRTAPAATAGTRPATRTRSARTTRPSSWRTTGPARAAASSGPPPTRVTRTCRLPGTTGGPARVGRLPGGSQQRLVPPRWLPGRPRLPGGRGLPGGLPWRAVRQPPAGCRAGCWPGHRRIPGRARGLPRRIVGQPPAGRAGLPRRSGLPGRSGLSWLFPPAGHCGLSRRAAGRRLRRISGRRRLWRAGRRLGGRHRRPVAGQLRQRAARGIVPLWPPRRQSRAPGTGPLSRPSLTVAAACLSVSLWLGCPWEDIFASRGRGASSGTEGFRHICL